jgi:hypothetical protein
VHVRCTARVGLALPFKVVVITLLFLLKTEPTLVELWCMLKRENTLGYYAKLNVKCKIVKETDF